MLTWGLGLGRILWKDLIIDQDNRSRWWTLVKTGMNLQVS
jgi:hypothetical protein